MIDRNPNRHVSFGVGLHRCVGSHLARIEFTEVITAVLTRLPDFEIDETAVVEYPNWSTIGGWARLPATFTPGTEERRCMTLVIRVARSSTAPATRRAPPTSRYATA